MDQASVHAAAVADALVHHRAGRLRQAETLYRAALATAPDNGLAWHFLGVIAHQAGRSDEAERLIRRALQLEPSAAALCNLGVALKAQGRMQEALDAYRAALTLAPEFADAWYNQGIALMAQQKPQAAIEAYDHALSIEPGHVKARWNRALALLASGDYERGWHEYEIRWRRRDRWSLDRRLSQPHWQGEDIQGKTLLLCAEQGMGDTLQFVRYVPLLAARGARIVLEVQPPLIRLLRKIPGVAEVVEQGNALPQFDRHCLLMSLPTLLGTTLQTIPAQIPYLSPDAARAAAWARRLVGETRLKVGLVWAGASRPEQPDAAAIDRLRSVPLSSYAPLAAVPDVRFISLQKGEPARQALHPPMGMTLDDWSGELTDFAETAALVANLDLVISVDTAVAHLAGALGKPVWLLSRYEGCWRWLLEREDSPWYPDMRLFRQRRVGDWDDVLQRVAAALAAQIMAPAEETGCLSSHDARAP